MILVGNPKQPSEISFRDDNGDIRRGRLFETNLNIFDEGLPLVSVSVDGEIRYVRCDKIVYD